MSVINENQLDICTIRESAKYISNECQQYLYSIANLLGFAS